MQYASNLIAQLGLRLEDPGEGTFYAPTKLQALNNAQLKVATLVDKSYLSKLQKIETDLTLTEGVFDLSTLTFGVLKGDQGIISAGIYGGKQARRIEVEDIPKLDNFFLQATTQNPVYYIFENKLMFFPVTVTKIDIRYLKVPTTLYYKFTGIPSGGTFSTSQWTGVTAEGLSTVDDTYNGAVVYCPEKGTHHIVTDYDGAGKVFTCSPVAGATFAKTDTIYFLSNPFVLTGISGVTCDLNDALIDPVLGYAEQECWLSDAKRERADKAEDKADKVIINLNDTAKKAEGIGTKGDKRNGGN